MTPADLQRALASRGHALVPARAGLAPEEAARAPWAYAERLLGERPALVERQPIKPVPAGRSFASTSVETPFHTDSQLFAGLPPRVQVMACVRPAPRGGACRLLDTWPLLDRVRAAAPDLYRLLFDAPRRIPFVFGDVLGPTVSLRNGCVVFTHAPVIPRGDAIAAQLAPWIEEDPGIEIDVPAGAILVVDNHRMLHGRRAFEGDREFVRLLVWLDRPGPSHPVHRAEAERAAAIRAASLADAPEAVRRPLGLGSAPSPVARVRLGVVLEMLRGVPPGVLAARERIPEPELYRWRDEALAAAGRALEEDV